MKKLQDLVRPNIWNLKPYTSAREEFVGTSSVLLDANESPYGTLNRYPDPQQRALKRQLAADQQLEENQVFTGNGSDEVLDLIYRIFCRPQQDEVVILGPTYGMYRVLADIHDVALTEVALNNQFDLDEGVIRQMLEKKKAKVLLVCSPNNPTGNSLNPKYLQQLIGSFPGIVVLDEAYVAFGKQASWVTQLARFPNLIVLQTLSKAHGLAAARVGMCFASAEVIALLNKVKAPYNISSLNQEAALAVLQNKAGFAMQVKSIVQEREVLRKALLQVEIIERVFPSEANFLLIQTSPANMLYDYLLQEGIVVRNRSAQVSNSLRLSVGSPIENQKLIQAIRAFNLSQK